VTSHNRSMTSRIRRCHDVLKWQYGDVSSELCLHALVLLKAGHVAGSVRLRKDRNQAITSQNVSVYEVINRYFTQTDAIYINFVTKCKIKKLRNSLQLDIR